MIDRLALILLDTKHTRNSVNALLGALETDRELAGLEVRLPRGESQLEQQIAESLAARKRAVVGISFTTPRLWRVRELMLRLRGAGMASRPGIADADRPLWIAGGPHPTADPEGTLRLGFSVVVRGEGEAAFCELLKTMASGGDLGAVAGIAFHDASGRPQLTGRRASIDLDAFPPFPLVRHRVGAIEITRGCPFACGFCQTSHLMGVRPRHRSIESIARYAAVIRKGKHCDVRVITPNAFSYGSPDGKTLNLPSLESLLATLREILRADGRPFFGTFPSEVRPEHVNDATLDLVKRFANNDYLVIGAQSGSDRVLAHAGRAHGVAEILSAVRCTLAAGLGAHVDFIFGLPGEGDEDVQETVRVIRELAAMGALIHAHTFMPLPQTRFASQPPGQLSGRVLQVMKELIGRGILYGEWDRQGREAQRISRYAREGES